jgi:hypothetical protein
MYDSPRRPSREGRASTCEVRVCWSISIGNSEVEARCVCSRHRTRLGNASAAVSLSHVFARREERRKQHADPRTKGERPAQRVDEQTQIARVADDNIESSRDQRMPRLDGHQPAEPIAEHQDGPDPQRTAGGKENHAKPANRIPIARVQHSFPSLGRQIRGRQPDQPEG